MESTISPLLTAKIDNRLSFNYWMVSTIRIAKGPNYLQNGLLPKIPGERVKGVDALGFENLVDAGFFQSISLSRCKSPRVLDVFHSQRTVITRPERRAGDKQGDFGPGIRRMQIIKDLRRALASADDSDVIDLVGVTQELGHDISVSRGVYNLLIQQRAWESRREFCLPTAGDNHMLCSHHSFFQG